MSRAGLLLGFFTIGMAAVFTSGVSAEPYPMPDERTRQNLNEATISADVIRSLPDPTGVLSGKGAVGVREYDELIRLLMDEYVGDGTISVEAFVSRYPDDFLDRWPHDLAVAEMRQQKVSAIAYACQQEEFHLGYLLEFLPSNLNDAETLRHNCNARDADNFAGTPDAEEPLQKATGE